MNRSCKIFVSLTLALIAGLGLTLSALAYLGDLNLDDLVNTFDLKTIAQALGVTLDTDPRWNAAADLNLDSDIDVKDLAIAGRSYGAQKIFHFPRLINNDSAEPGLLRACLDRKDQLHVAWIASHKAYYTRLDRFGNTLVDDVLLDSSQFTGNYGLALACDADGNTHLIWSSGGGTDLYQARFDAFGFLVMPKGLLWDDMSSNPDIALDSQDRAHVYFREYYGQHPVYMLVSKGGEILIWDDTVHTHEPTSSTNYFKVAVDAGDNVHLLTTELNGEDELHYARIGVGDTPSLPERIIGLLHWDGGSSGVQAPFIKTDSQRNAYVLWNTYGEDSGSKLYLEKINPAGVSVVDDFQLFPEWHTPASGMATSSFDLDASSQLHLFSYTGWGGSSEYAAYGVFDDLGLPVEPMRWIVYGGVPGYPQLSVDSQGEAQLVYRTSAVTGSGSPTCPAEKVCYVSSAWDAAAYDQSFPDLGVDNAHLSWEPKAARWNQNLTVNGVIFNAGWASSPASTATIDIQLSPDWLIGPPAQATVEIPALAPHQTYSFSAVLTLPFSPPAGFEKVSFVRLLIQVDPNQLIRETTEANNNTNPAVVVVPLPTTAGLWTEIQDNTDTARGGEPNYANTGIIYLSGPGINRSVAVSDYGTLVANDLPVGTSPATYTLNWEALGYRNAAPVQVTIQRSATDPYHIDYNPSNSPALETDRWGSINGTVTDAATNNPISGVTVRIEGEGLSLQATTNASGQFSPTTKAELGKMIPGSYQVRLSKANYARLVVAVPIANLEQVNRSWAMNPTTKAYVHGNVINSLGFPVTGADINACGLHAASAETGVFDMEVTASCTSLVVSKPGFTTLNEPISLTAGLESLFGDLTLDFDPPLTTVFAQNTVGSRIIEESTEDLLPDEPDDAGWAISEFWDEFKNEFWSSASATIKIVYGGFHYELGVGYSGSGSDRYLQQLQVRLDPRTFEVHMLLSEVQYEGVTIPIPIVEDSGITSAIYGLEAQLVDADSGTVIATTRQTLEDGAGSSAWLALDDTIRTYSFNGIHIDDWDNAEVRFYQKVGYNNGGRFDSHPLLYQFDHQFLRIDLSSGTAWGSYCLVNCPEP